MFVSTWNFQAFIILRICLKNNFEYIAALQGNFLGVARVNHKEHLDKIYADDEEQQLNGKRNENDEDLENGSDTADNTNKGIIL